ncbi:MAG: hypothetical protein ACK45I_02615 [Bacteroidota bacterium]
MKYQLEIQEHEDSGDFGIVITNVRHPYFEPAVSGLTLAHDIVEHPFTPHQDGIADELQALAGLYWVRYLTRWQNDRLHFEPLGKESFVFEIPRLIEPFLYHSAPAIPECELRYVRDSDFSRFMDNVIAEGIELTKREHDDAEEMIDNMSDDIKIHFKRWMCAGYQKIRSRFPNRYFALEVFDQIRQVSDTWLNNCEVAGQRAELEVIISREFVRLEEERLEEWDM